jgi:hypothetical protein
MKCVALLAACTLLAPCASIASPLEQQPLLLEQVRLQAASDRYRREVPDDGNLPLEFQQSDAPRGHNVINLSF